jgi:hypothetical protein
LAFLLLDELGPQVQLEQFSSLMKGVQLVFGVLVVDWPPLLNKAPLLRVRVCV